MRASGFGYDASGSRGLLSWVKITVEGSEFQGTCYGWNDAVDVDGAHDLSEAKPPL